MRIPATVRIVALAQGVRVPPEGRALCGAPDLSPNLHIHVAHPQTATDPRPRGAAGGGALTEPQRRASGGCRFITLDRRQRRRRRAGVKGGRARRPRPPQGSPPGLGASGSVTFHPVPVRTVWISRVFLPSFLFPFRFPRPPSLLPHSLFVGRRPSPSVFRELRVMKSGPPVPRGRPGSPRSPGQAASPRRSPVTLRTGLSCQPGKTALSRARGLGWTAPRRTPSHTIGTPTYSFKAHPSFLKTVNSFNSSFLKILETCFSMTADIQYSIRVRCTAEAVRP